MRKLYRTALFAGVLAFGVAACGDDVQIVEPEPTPPPALQVTLTPAEATATVGENASFAVGISGGEASAEANWTCASANPSVASVSGTATGCQATALSAGNTQITVTVTKGDQSSNAGAQLNVTAVADDPATVSIDRITQGGTTNPVDISNVQGQIDVTLNLDEGDETPTQVDVLVDGEVAASQVFTSAMLAEMAEEAEAAGQEVQSITLSFNTGAYDVDEEAFTATAHHENGERVIGAQVHVEEREAPRNASNTITVEFNNDNTFHVLADRTGIDTAMDPDGLLWYGGPDFEITVYPIPVMYDGEVVVQMTARLDNDGGSVCPNQTDDEAPFGFTFDCEDVEAMGHLPVVQSTVTESGENGPMTGFGAALNIANVDDSDDHPFPMRIDVQSPNADGSIVIIRQSGLNNTGNWVNDEYDFLQEDAYERPTDDGVAGVTEELFIDDLDEDMTITVADLMESVTNERYQLRVVAEDALANARTITQSGNDPDHSATTFGYDVTDPVFEVEDDEDVVGQLTEDYNIINRFDAGDGVYIRTTDNLAGFNETYAAEHAIISVRGEFQGEGAIETASIVTASPAGIASMPFAAVAAGDPIANMVSVPTTLVDHIDQTAFELEIDDFGLLVEDPREDAMARYYIYQLRMRDQAGNVNKAFRAIYLNNFSVPSLQNLSNPSVFDGMTTFEASVAMDSVEVLEGSLELHYPSLGTGAEADPGGTLVWERPTADISSLFRMNANILDGELFNDVIYRPQNDVEFPLGLDAMGLPFIKSIQTMANGTEGAKPDTVRARAFNGYGADDESLNHSAASAGGSGFSPMLENPIRDEEVDDADEVYADLHEGAWTFEIVDNSATDCDADYCVRAVGPQSTFTNPFDGGPMYVIWADDAGTGDNGELQWRILGEADANFDHPFPTRDAGADRIYEWEFSDPVSGTNPGELTGDIAFGALGVNANSGDALVVSEFVEQPDPEFNVMFEESSYDVVIDGDPVLMDVLHGTNSTEDSGTATGFTVDACVFIDENGNTMVTPPDGMSVGVVGNACEVTAVTGDDVPGSFTVQAQVTEDGTGATDTAETTVVAGLEDFEIELTPATATVEVPEDGGTAATQVYTVGVVTGGAISAMNCSLSSTAQGVSVATDAGAGTCTVTVTDAASAGTFDVVADATEDGTGRTAQAISELVVEEVEFTVTPDPAEIDWQDGVEIALDVGGSRTNADVSQVAATTDCAVNSAALDATIGFDGDDPFCLVEVNDPTAVEEDDEFEVTWTIEFISDGRVDTVVSDAFLGERPVFDPVLDFSLGGDSADNRRDIERDRTAFFAVLEGEGIGIDLVESTAVVTPSGGGTPVTADVVEDGGTVLLNVTVPATTDTGNYMITVTFEEEGTGDTKTIDVFITVTDLGTIEIDDGAL